MNIEGGRGLVLGGSGLVGTAVCRKLLGREPATLIVHSRRPDRAPSVARVLKSESQNTEMTATTGDIFGLHGEPSQRERIFAQVRQLRSEDLGKFSLYQLLVNRAEDGTPALSSTSTR